MNARLWPKRLVGGLVVVALWELAHRQNLLNPLIFGSPSLIVAAAIKDGPAFLAAFAFTACEILVATAIAWTGGVAVGVVAGASVVRSHIFAPTFAAVIAVPLVVLYPVAIAWLGIGAASKIAYAAVAGALPIALSTVLGLRSIDRRYVAMARSVGASGSRYSRRC